MSELIGPLKAPLARLISIYGEDFMKKGPLFPDKMKGEFGQCFSLVKQFVPELGNTSTQDWAQGELLFNINGSPRFAVFNPSYFFGAAIATFDENGKVYHYTDPRSTHGAIFLNPGFKQIDEKNVPGFWVIDQWVRRNHSGIRFIRVQNSKARSDNARAFSIVMLNK